MALPPLLEKSLVVPEDAIYRLSVEQYHDMINAGILTDDDPVELLEGWLVTKMPKNPRHSLATQLTYDALVELAPQGWHIKMQEPFTTEDSEPEPDVMVVRGNLRDYAEQHPSPADIALIIEVSAATLHRDRTLKLRLYAGAEIPAYWIINLQEDQLEAYAEPTGAGTQATYAARVVYRMSDHVPVVIDGQEVGRLSVQSLMA